MTTFQSGTPFTIKDSAAASAFGLACTGTPTTPQLVGTIAQGTTSGSIGDRVRKGYLSLANFAPAPSVGPDGSTGFGNLTKDRAGARHRPSLAPYLNPKRFRWVFFADSVLFPFDHRRTIAKNVDEATYIPLQEEKLHRELKQEALPGLPNTFDEYLAFVTRLLEDNQKHGGIAIKFEIAYFRPLHFDDPDKQTAQDIYAKYHSGNAPTDREYLDFQDYVFRYLIREAGRLHLRVHIHSAVGIGDFFSLSENNVLQLENILRDPRYDSTTFVLLHGGYPYQDQAIWLAARRNVYLDSSLIELYLYPADFKNVLRRWLLLFPDKVVFGSDALPFNDAVGSEESYWLAVRTARISLAPALAEMVLNHEVSEAKAIGFAHAYLHDTAADLYPQ